MALPARSALSAVAALLLLPLTLPAHADNARFDLTGPKVDIRITRDGTSLPVAMVPNLLEGDQLWVHAELPETQSVKYLLTVVFLRGTTNPPPENWIMPIETWDKRIRSEGARVTVPEGAQQAVILLAPVTGGDLSTLRSAVRGRPGIFVRASQDLDEAGFEQARIEKYLDEIKQVPPGDSKALAEHSDFLARTLNLRPNPDCFKRPVEQQYTCLTQTGSQTLLDDGHGQSIVNSLTSGASSDLITAASSTSLAGGGLYSAYVGAIVDVVRVMSSLHTAHYQYIPAIAFPQDEALNLRLNVPPSFQNPKSVIVVGLPAIQKATPPPLRASDVKQVTCLLKPSVALAVEGAPLVFSTDFTHDLLLHRNEPGKSPDLPLTPDAFRGGLVVGAPGTPTRQELNDKGQKVPSIAPPPPPARDPAQASPAPASDAPAPHPQGPSAADPGTEPDDVPPPAPVSNTKTGVVQGFWGFDHFTGPTLSVQDTPGTDWKLSTSTDHIIVGEKNHLTLSSTGTACIESIVAQEGSAPEQKLEWKPGDKPNTVTFDLPLHSDNAGAVQISVHQFGKPAPDTLSIQSFSKPAELKTLEYHTGDKHLILTGTGLSEVREVSFSGLTFTPPAASTPGETVISAETPENAANTLILNLSGGDVAAKPQGGKDQTAHVTLVDGRVLSLPFSIGDARPVLTILSRRSVPASTAATPIHLTSDQDVPLDGQLLLSLRAASPFPRDAQVEIASQDNALHDKLTLADGSLVLQDRMTVLARIDLQKTFGSSAFGPLQIRLVLHNGTASDWQPLATLVRLPTLTGLTCTTAGTLNCALVGSNLFLLQAVSSDPALANPVEVPDGFVGSTLMVNRPGANSTLYLKLRDDPATINTIVLPPQQQP